MANGTQTPTVLATPYNSGTTNPGNLATTNVAPGPGVDPVSGLITGGLSLGTANSEYNLAKEIAGNAMQGTQSALDRIAAFLNDPTSVTKMPGYQFGMDTGIQAVNRGAGASGLLNSGNRLQALQDFGQNYAGTWIDRMWNELTGNVSANLGAGQLQLGAGNILMGGLDRRNQALTGGAAGILSSIFGNNSILNSPIWQQIMKAIGGGSGDGGFNVPPSNETFGPPDPNQFGPPDPGFDPFTPVAMPTDPVGFDPGIFDPIAGP